MSPVHTDDYLAAKAAEIAAVPEIDGVLFYDTAGVLDVSRLRALVPKIVAAAAPKPVEIHANNLMGMSGLTYVEAVRHGIHVLHTATRSMANGPSIPSTESVVRNLELMGCTHSIDTSLLAPVEEHFRRVGRAAGYLVDPVSEYDLFNVTHQVPGGMVGTLQGAARAARDGAPHRRGAGRDGRGAARARLAGDGDAAEPARRHPGGAERRDGRSATGSCPTRWSPTRPATTASRPRRSTPDVLDRIMASAQADRVVAQPAGAADARGAARRHGTGPDEDDLLILQGAHPRVATSPRCRRPARCGATIR